jgi:glycyl-tRNA synthetase beta chain
VQLFGDEIKAAREGAAQRLSRELDRAVQAFVREAERVLAERVATLGFEVDGDLREQLAEAARLAPLVERFFDEVLVMADDPRIRANRLRLLLDLRDKLRALGDLSQIPV